MCNNVSEELRELVRQRLAAAVEDVFELVERAITGYEEETQRQRVLLEQLLQPRVRVPKVHDQPLHIKEELQPERPRVKQEQDVIINGSLKTEELHSVSSWDHSPPQTQPDEGSESWPSSVPPTQTKEEQPPSSQDKQEPLFSSYTEEESLPLSYTEEGRQSPSYNEEGVQTFTQPFTESLPPSYTAGEPLFPSYAEEEPLSPSYTEQGSQTFPQIKEDPVPSPMTPGQIENDTQFVCAFCSKVFRRKSLLARHMKVHSGERPYRCLVCNRSFTRTTHLNRHFLGIHGYENPQKAKRKIQRYSCDFCSQKCVSKYHLERHMKVHISGAQFKQKKSLQLQLQIQTRDSSEKNINWTAPLEDNTELAQPQSSLSADKRPPRSNSKQQSQKYMKCPICFKTIQTARLTRHIRIHTGEKPFSCAVCGKSFNRKDAMQAHMIVHSEERPFTCSICGISKKRRSDIREHMRIHSGQGEILTSAQVTQEERASAGPSGESANVLSNNKKICPICGKVVLCLKKHMQTHSAHRPYGCSVCGRRFSRNQHLQRHKVLHTRTSAFSRPRSDSHESQVGKRSETGIIYCRIDD